MAETGSEKWGTFISAVLVVTLLGGWVIPLGIYNYYDVKCANESVSFEKSSVDDPGRYSGENTVLQNGKSGIKKVCVHENGKLYSSSMLSDPVAEVTYVGTMTRPTSYQSFYSTPAPVSQNCAVTLCNDGSCSFSQGRGTCSWHGGVSRYY